jgi:hypothetical protein
MHGTLHWTTGEGRAIADRRFAGWLVLAFGIALSAVSASRVADVYPHLRDLGAVGAGIAGPASGPDSLPRAAVLADLATCRADYATTLRQAAVVDASVILDGCLARAEAFAAAAPSDPWGWLQVAGLRLDLRGPGPSALAALRRSWETGPADGSVLPRRPASALRVWRLMDIEDRAAFGRDLAATVQLRGDLTQITRLAVSGSGPLAIVREAMETLPVDDQEVLLAALKDAAAVRDEFR